MEERGQNPVFRRIDKVIHKCECNMNYIHGVSKHLKVAKEHLFKEENEFTCREELIDVLLSKLFLMQPDIFPPTRYESKIDENFDWPVPPCPSEAFGNDKFPDIRIKDFFECLKVGQVLDCRVVSVLPMEYRLLVIHKYGSIRILEDLNILVTLPRIKLEIKALQKDFEVCELIRVGVSHIENKEIKVTLDDSTLPITGNIKLGALPESSLPQYVLNRTAFADFATLTDYLNTHPRFQNPLLLNSILEAYGYDVKRVSSYYSDFDNLKCSDRLTGKALLKSTKDKDLKTYLDAALKDFQERNIPKALDEIQLALECDNKCPKIYEIRGAIYADLDKPKMSKKAFWDFEMAYNLNGNSSSVRKEISKFQFKTAIKFYYTKIYEKAVVACENALSLDKDNVRAAKLLKYLKEKHPEAFKNLHEEEEEKLKNLRNRISSDLLAIKVEPVD